MANMFAAGVGVRLDRPVIPKSVEPKMAWVDGPNGRRPSSTEVELDEHGRPGHVVKAEFPLGKDGAKETVEVTVWSHVVPELSFADFYDEQIGIPVEFENLRMYVRAAKTRGVDVTMSAEGMRTVASGRPASRRGVGAAAQADSEQAG